MKYDSWENMVDAQAVAFSSLCARNERLNELAEKADTDGYNSLTEAERNEFVALMDGVNDNPFFSLRCEEEWDEMDEQEHPELFEEPNSWDELEKESYADLFGPWWE